MHVLYIMGGRHRQKYEVCQKGKSNVNWFIGAVQNRLSDLEMMQPKYK